MLFRRRKPLRFYEKLNHFMWPKRGWRRAIRYYSKRLLRMTDTPHSIAAGFAVGVAFATTPFIGFHYLLGVIGSFLVRGNVVAAVVGTTVGNPLTFPFIWFATFETGNMILSWFGRETTSHSADHLAHHLWNDSMASLWPIIEPMLIGCIPIALVAGSIAYLTVFFAADAFQASRRERFAIRRRELHGTRS
jgi:uncharacterized protein (DUF2062 family)